MLVPKQPEGMEMLPRQVEKSFNCGEGLLAVVGKLPVGEGGVLESHPVEMDESRKP